MNDISLLMNIAKKIVEPSVYLRLNSVSKDNDFEKTLTSSLVYHLERRLLHYQRLLETVKIDGKDVFFAEQFLGFIPGKLIHLNRSFSEPTFYHVLTLFKRFEEEIGYV